ncbi:MAG: hypothetical protein ABFE16_14155 [Armatimonadia bacterium]
MKRRAVVLVALMVVILSFVGCGGGGGGASTRVDAALVGTWSIQSVTLDSAPQAVNWSEVLVVNSNGTFRNDSNESGTAHFISGTLNAAGGSFSARVTKSSDPAQVGNTHSGSYTASSGQLSMTTNEDGHQRTVVYTLSDSADWAVNASFTGRWVLASRTSDGVPSSPDTAVLEVTADGSFQRWTDNVDNWVKGLVLTKGNQVRLQCTDVHTSQGPGTLVEGTYTLGNNSILLTMQDGGHTVVETYSKLQTTTSAIAGEYLLVCAKKGGNLEGIGAMVITLGADRSYSVVDKNSGSTVESGVLEFSSNGQVVMRVTTSDDAGAVGSFKTMSCTQADNLLQCTEIADETSMIKLAKLTGNVGAASQGTWLITASKAPSGTTEAPLGDNGTTVNVNASTLRATSWSTTHRTGSTLEASVVVYGGQYWLVHRTSGSWDGVGPTSVRPTVVSDWQLLVSKPVGSPTQLYATPLGLSEDPFEYCAVFDRCDASLPTSLVGTWTLQSCTVNNVPQSVTADSLQVTGGGFYTYTSGSFSETGAVRTFAGKAGETTVASNTQTGDVGKLSAFRYSVSGNQLTMRQHQDGTGNIVSIYTK